MHYGLQAEGLVKHFGKTVALSGVDLAAEPGTVLGVLGPNGAGKTTMVRILATLLRPDGGKVTVAGFDVVREATRVRRHIGLTGQYASVDEELTGAENLVIIGQLLGLRAAEAKARARRLLGQFELTDSAGRCVSTYSGGMRRRLDLAASLVGRPLVIFLDEPTTGLDPVKRDDIWRIIRAMTDDGGTVLLTTQYMEEADALADQIAVIDRGEVIAAGTPAELKQRAGSQTIVLRPRLAQQLDQAAAILAEATGNAAERAPGNILTVPVAGEADFIKTVRRIDATGIGVLELSLRLPRLDEVFFSLTGQHAVKTPVLEETL